MNDLSLSLTVRTCCRCRVVHFINVKPVNWTFIHSFIPCIADLYVDALIVKTNVTLSQFVV